MTKQQLEKTLKVKFRNGKILQKALTHRSWVNEHKNLDPENNERLEFLGDAILEFWVTKTLFALFPKLPEGSLTNIRASLVCTENLAQKSKKLNLDKALLLGKGEEQGGGRDNLSLLADVFEAIIGGIFIDSGLKKTEAFLERNFLAKLRRLGKRGDVKDAKTLFQELTQEKNKITPNYQVISETGPEHKKVFRVGVFVKNKKIASGKGHSKKEAEEAAAQKALTSYSKTSKMHHQNVKNKTLSAR